ncbi:hypothetical protein CTM97_21310 [Photobacterium phosphoreum]|uniref:Uncharacterized protein n=1 Tax=Photobacterium phosphoreum TaxID=659 RepID=A0A2T3JBF6_PHOPO|nr:hypothetical protein [Photobacterium phosphoreum]PSU19606.1 hypothetical protein CTM96_20940 [Photobacterium phosphoreum]PSU36798.1 hypothetical protein CTM97_21310 [Photobacterium phosphoreum]PSU46143.1 hypothetical protein C9J18_20990 [Photobacterium phosphoreum]
MKKFLFLFVFLSNGVLADGLVISFKEAINLHGQDIIYMDTGDIYLPYHPTGEYQIVEFEGNQYKLLNHPYKRQCDYRATYVSNAEDDNGIFTITEDMPIGCSQKGVIRPTISNIVWRGDLEMEAQNCTFPIKLIQSKLENTVKISMDNTYPTIISKECRNIRWLWPELTYQVTESPGVMRLRSPEPFLSDIHGLVNIVRGVKYFDFFEQTITGYDLGKSGKHTYIISGQFSIPVVDVD